mgnify:CR=1 FL=1
MEMTAYLSFMGDCEAAFKFYEQCLGAQAGRDLPLRRVADGEARCLADWSDKVMHGSLTVGGQRSWRCRRHARAVRSQRALRLRCTDEERGGCRANLPGCSQRRAVVVMQLEKTLLGRSVRHGRGSLWHPDGYINREGATQH